MSEIRSSSPNALLYDLKLHESSDAENGDSSGANVELDPYLFVEDTEFFFSESEDDPEDCSPEFKGNPEDYSSDREKASITDTKSSDAENNASDYWASDYF